MLRASGCGLIVPPNALRCKELRHVGEGQNASEHRCPAPQAEVWQANQELRRLKPSAGLELSFSTATVFGSGRNGKRAGTVGCFSTFGTSAWRCNKRCCRAGERQCFPHQAGLRIRTTQIPRRQVQEQAAVTPSSRRKPGRGRRSACRRRGWQQAPYPTACHRGYIGTGSRC